MKNQTTETITDSIVSFKNGGSVLKDDLLKKFRFEKHYCKKHHQSTLWTYFHYQTGMMQFADKKSQVRTVNDLWKSQGFKFSKQTNKPHMAEAIGARSVIGHVWKNEAITEASGQNYTEPLSTLMGYMNGSIEVVTWEINW